MLAAARRLGASLVLLALVYQGRSVLETRAGGVSEARRALAAANIVTDCTSAMQDGCCDSQDSCGSEWQPVCGALPSTSTWRYDSASGETIATNYTHNYTFLSVRRRRQPSTPRVRAPQGRGSGPLARRNASQLAREPLSPCGCRSQPNPIPALWPLPCVWSTPALPP